MRFWPRKAVEEPVDPPTKPEDRTREVFGLSCPNHHLIPSKPGTILPLSGMCTTCGKTMKPSLLLRRDQAFRGIDAYWVFYYFSPFSGELWSSTVYEFVRYLDTPKPRRKK
jgi:hypothetical protein